MTLLRTLLALALAASLFVSGCCCAGGSDSDNNQDTNLQNPQT